jgi:hypothetical protein
MSVEKSKVNYGRGSGEGNEMIIGRPGGVCR